MRQFKSTEEGKPANIEFNPEEFEAKVNELYDEKNLKDGYAPFCKHIFIENFTEAKVFYAPITKENEKNLK